jgi:hypothetical protein
MRNVPSGDQNLVDAAALNPRKPYYKTTYRNDILRFATPAPAVPGAASPIPISYTAVGASSFYAAGYTAGGDLKAMQFTPSATGGPDLSASSGTTTIRAITDSNKATLRGNWQNGIYFYAVYTSSLGNISLGRTFASGNLAPTNQGVPSGLPQAFITNASGTTKASAVRPSARIVMEHGDQLIVMTSYKFMEEINQMVCTMTFYHSEPNLQVFRRLRTVIQYECTDTVSTTGQFDVNSGRVFAMSYSAGKFFVIANDGTKAIRFTYNQGVEGMAEPIIPIDIDANRLEITDQTNGQKTYGKYHQFMPSSIAKINNRYYLNGQMTRTYSNGDMRVMEIYLWSADGINWSIGDVSSFIDAHYYKRGETVKLRNYCLVYWPGSSTLYAIGSGCGTSATAREIDAGVVETDFSSTVISGHIQNATNSADKADLLVMKGFNTVDPAVLGGKTITVELGYYNASNELRSTKMGEYFVDSELHELNSFGRGPNRVTTTDSGSWKLTRWSSITDIDRWSSTYIKDDLKVLSKLIVKGISSDYQAIDNATGTGLYLSNLNDPFVGYTSTRDDRDGMFTVCARFVRTGTGANAMAKLSSIGLLIGAEDYTDIYTKGAADRKGFNAIMIPAESTWTGRAKTGPEMRKSNLKRRADDPSTPENESDADKAFQWIRRYTSLWERDVYAPDGDSAYNKITANTASATGAGTGSGAVIYTSAFTAEHNTDYEFVVRKQSGRIQTFARKKGRTESTVAAATHTEYQLIHQYQFTREDIMNWGPRPFWGLVANTDVFASLDGWNSREYGNIETGLTEAYNIIGGFSDFPDSNLASYGFQEVIGSQGGYQTIVIPGETQQFYSEGNLEIIETKKPVSYQIFVGEVNQSVSYIEDCPVQSLHVGEIVRCLIFSDLGGATTGSIITQVNCGHNIIRQGAGQNINPRAEFITIIASIETVQDGRKRIRFGRRWSIGGSPTAITGENFDYAIYKVGYSDQYARAFSGSTTSDVLLDILGSKLSLDLKPGAVKQASVSIGKAAFVNRQNDAIFTRVVSTDGVSHSILSGSRYVDSQTGIGGTNLGFDYPVNPISNANFVGSNGLVSTRDWRMILYQGRLFPFSASSVGLPSGFGNNNRAYMIKGGEIVRYSDFSWQNRGTNNFTTWCMIPTYYTPIFPSVKGQAFVQQWSILSPTVAQVTVDQPTSNQWIEPGDKFSDIQNLAGLRVYINSKSGYYSVEEDVKHYAVSSAPSNNADSASTLTFTPALKAGADSMNVQEERAKDADKQIKEIAVVSGREQFETSSGMQSYADPLCFYPVGSDATEKADSFIKVNYWTMNAGLYNSAKDNLKYACNLAGVFDVQFMDTSPALPTLAASASNFLIELTGAVTTSSSITVNMRSAYTLLIEVKAGGILTLTLSTQFGFSPAKNISGNGDGNAQVIAKASIPVSDFEIAGTRDFRIILRKERLMVEMDMQPVWTFDLKTYKFGGAKFDQFDLFTDQAGPLTMTLSGVSSSSHKLVELSDEVENQIIDMAQSGGEAVQFVTRERHIHVRSTQNGGLQFGRFMDDNRTSVSLTSSGAALTENFIKDQLEYNPFQVPGHVLVTGAEYGEHLDPEWIRQNGYMFASNQNRLLDTVEDSIREAKLLIRMSKEDSDNSDLEMVGLPHIQPEDQIKKVYSFPETVAANEQDQIVSAHAIQFDQSSLKSLFKIRRKYSME